jgi:hypothetical protein
MAEQKKFGDDGLRIARDLFAAWDAYQADADRARLQAQIAPLQGKLRALLEHAARKSPRTKYHRLFARNLLKRWPALWTFTTPTASSRPTTTPNAASAAPSSTANSHSAANPTKASAQSNDSSPPHSPAASRNARSSPYLTDVIHASIRGDPIPALA